MCAASASAQGVLPAKVVTYGSGTAFAVLDGLQKLHRVKLSGADAPEKTQRFGPESQKLASEWLGLKPFEIAIDSVDKQGRIFGRVTVDGRDVGLELIKAGLAWCDPTDPAGVPQVIRENYLRECTLAKTQRRGLWQDSNPTPPWEHRKIPQFEPIPGASHTTTRSCVEIGYQTVQCDDGKSYRMVGNQLIGSDGIVYNRRGNTFSGSDGNSFELKGSSTYGTDGTVCRTRGKRTDCF